VFLSNKVCANKLVPYSELIIFIRYNENGYCFICHIQENIIFHPIDAIFNKEFFSKYADSHVKECKLYDKLDKINLKTGFSASEPSNEDGPTLVPIPPP